MSFRSNVLRWVVPFPPAILLTPIAALGGTLGTMALGGMTYCLLSLTSPSCSDFLAAGVFFGTMFAAPCTLLLIPLFYILWGSSMRLGLFVIICAALGLATIQAWEFVLNLVNPSQMRVPGPDPLPLAGTIGAFVFSILYFPIMRFFDRRFSPRHIAGNNGAAT